MANAPVAIGPVSRTVVGAESDSPSVATVLKPKKEPMQWKKLLVPAGIAGVIFLALKYKGHV